MQCYNLLLLMVAHIYYHLDRKSNPLNVPENTVMDIAGFGGATLSVLALCSNGDLWAWGYNEQNGVTSSNKKKVR